MCSKVAGAVGSSTAGATGTSTGASVTVGFVVFFSTFFSSAGASCVFLAFVVFATSLSDVLAVFLSAASSDFLAVPFLGRVA